jgi:steroid 5-alpha reductase family enzyme
MVALWAIRLWAHLLWRSLGKSEDPRYRAFRERFGPERYWWVSFFQVFLLLGALVLVISAPLQAALAAPAGPLRWNHLAGLLLFAAGFGFEAVGDWQLLRFRSLRANRAKILDTGLWQWTRHPNYFGEALLWWGFWLFALDAPWGLATVFAPALMTFLLLRVSGVTTLEKHLAKSRPGYADYAARTNSFFPRRPFSLSSSRQG